MYIEIVKHTKTMKVRFTSLDTLHFLKAGQQCIPTIMAQQSTKWYPLAA